MDDVYESIDKLRQLDAIAEADEIYQIWFKSYQELRDAFKEYADNQPEEIYRLLWGYTDTYAMALQRKTFIACENMEFKKPKKAAWLRLLQRIRRLFS